MKKSKILAKKAQLEIMQTAFVLLIVLMLFIVGFIFLMSKYTRDLKSKGDDSVVLNDINRYQILNFLPELKCSHNGVFIYECYDKEKLESFKTQIIANDLFYKDIFGYSKLTIGEYDNSGILIEAIIFDNPKPEYLNKMFISHPIIIYDNEKKLADEGVMSLEIYD